MWRIAAVLLSVMMIVGISNMTMSGSTAVMNLPATINVPVFADVVPDQTPAPPVVEQGVLVAVDCTNDACLYRRQVVPVRRAVKVVAKVAKDCAGGVCIFRRQAVEGVPQPYDVEVEAVEGSEGTERGIGRGLLRGVVKVAVKPLRLLRRSRGSCGE